MLIVGGFDGTSALASVDVYDPRTNTVSAGPSLAIGRAGHSATTLLDGRVLIAGGASDSSELASAEIFDPSTESFTVAANTMSVARQRHVAFLLPHNNNVLIVGGTSGGNAVATAELYTPCTPGIDDPVDESFTTTGGTALRYDSTAGQFIQNWQSPKVAGKCYAVTMTAQDSSTVTAYFKTK